MSVETASPPLVASVASPWGRQQKTSEPKAKSLLEVMADAQKESDWDKSASLAKQLQSLEYEAFLQNAQPNPSDVGNAAVVADVDDEQHVHADTKIIVQDTQTPPTVTTATTTSTPSSSPSAVVAESLSDFEMALLLQAQFDTEHDDQVAQREALANKHKGKVSISLDLYRRTGNASSRRAHCEVTHGDSDDDLDDAVYDGLQYDKGCRVMRTADGDIVTKHNPDVNSARNGKKLMESLPLSFPSGDMANQKRQIKMSNKVFNQCMTYAHKSEKSRHRTKEQKDTSTSDFSLDTKTRLVLFRMVNANILDTVNGAISTGKEAVVFHASRHVDPDDNESEVQEVAIKVFKTTLTEFKQRQQFLHGDRRYEDRVGKQSARKLVKLWAEKESANLERVSRAGLPCPQVVIQHKHVLVMSFIGTDGVAAPKLKDAILSQRGIESCLEQVRTALVTLYQSCCLVHADLSEYNLLYHKKTIYIIDVGQAVEVSHPRADEFLYRDCLAIYRFFTKAGAANPPTASELFCEGGLTAKTDPGPLFSDPFRAANISTSAEDTSAAAIDEGDGLTSSEDEGDDDNGVLLRQIIKSSRLPPQPTIDTPGDQ